MKSLRSSDKLLFIAKIADFGFAKRVTSNPK